MTTKILTECPYKYKCVDVDSEKCKSCLNNEKRSYYRPEQPYFIYPIYPVYCQPYYPYYEPIYTPYTTYSDQSDYTYCQPVN